MSELSKLSELALKLPKGLASDWEGTNHFELSSDDECCWLDVSDGLVGVKNPMDSILGQRYGLLMDIAEEVGRLRDIGVFDKYLPKTRFNHPKIETVTGTQSADGTINLDLHMIKYELGKTIVPYTDPAILPHITDLQDRFKASDEASEPRSET